MIKHEILNDKIYYRVEETYSGKPLAQDQMHDPQIIDAVMRKICDLNYFYADILKLKNDETLFSRIVNSDSFLKEFNEKTIPVFDAL